MASSSYVPIPDFRPVPNFRPVNSKHPWVLTRETTAQQIAQLQAPMGAYSEDYGTTNSRTRSRALQYSFRSYNALHTTYSYSGVHVRIFFIDDKDRNGLEEVDDHLALGSVVHHRHHIDNVKTDKANERHDNQRFLPGPFKPGRERGGRGEGGRERGREGGRGGGREGGREGGKEGEGEGGKEAGREGGREGGREEAGREGGRRNQGGN